MPLSEIKWKRIAKGVGLKMIDLGEDEKGKLYLMKIELASVFGLLAFMLNFIPSVGSVVATLLPLPMPQEVVAHSPTPSIVRTIARSKGLG